MTSTWETQPVSLTLLRSHCEHWSENIGAFEFLHQEGIVPHRVKTMPAEKVRTTIDPEHIPAGYLASAAYEWDSWGPSHPAEFVSALEAELHPEKRDLIAKLLTALGRSEK